jgi:hypothetical protein
MIRVVCSFAFALCLQGWSESSLYSRWNNQPSSGIAEPTPMAPAGGTPGQGVSSLAGQQYAQMNEAMSQARTALVQKAFSPSDFAKNLTQISPQLLERARPQIEWIERAGQTLNAGGGVPLAESFPGLAQGIRDQDPFAVVRGLDDYGRALLGKSAEARALHGKLDGLLVDSQGLISGLADAPAPVTLVTPWASPEGVRVRGSLNRLMVSKQTLTNVERTQCAKGSSYCRQFREQLSSFNTKYDDLALLHAVADRLGLAGDPAFQAVMAGLESTSDSMLGFAEGLRNVGEDLAQLVIHPIDSANAIVSGVKFFFNQNAEARKMVANALAETGETFLNGTPFDRGKIVGRVTGELLTFLIPPAKLGKFKVLTALETSVGTATTSVAEKLSALAQKGAFPLLTRATEAALDTVAATRRIASLEKAGALSASQAKQVQALANVLPRTAASIAERPILAGELSEFAEILAHSNPQSLLHAAAADLPVKNLLQTVGGQAVDFAKDRGLDSLTGLAVLEKASPGVLAEWRTAAQVDALAELSTQVGLGLEAALTSELESIQSVLKGSLELISEGGTPPSAGTYKFLVSQAFNTRSILGEGSAFTPSVVKDIAKSYDQLDRLWPSVPATSFKGTVWRGIEKQVTDTSTGRNRLRAASEVFEINDYNLRANHRYSQPGEIALYAVVGTEDAAKVTIEAELRLPRESIIFGQKSVDLTKVIDLTSGATLEHLRITREMIGIPVGGFKGNGYTLTHQLGNLARKYGFEGLIAPSAKDTTGKMIILFSKGAP